MSSTLSITRFILSTLKNVGTFCFVTDHILLEFDSECVPCAALYTHTPEIIFTSCLKEKAPVHMMIQHMIRYL